MGRQRRRFVDTTLTLLLPLLVMLLAMQVRFIGEPAAASATVPPEPGRVVHLVPLPDSDPGSGAVDQRVRELRRTVPPQDLWLNRSSSSASPTHP